MGLQYRPLGVVKEMLERIGLEVTYAYEDLVFLKDNSFLLQFGKVGELLFFYANVETTEAEAQRLFTTIQSVANAEDITLISRGRYRLSAGADETLSLQFLDSTPE
jgi:hypothetical protein